MRRAAGLLAALATLACAAPPPPNLLANGSFESGREPWFDFSGPTKPYWGSFAISEAFATDGAASLELDLDSTRFRTRVGIEGAGQDVATDRLPQRFRGRYRVEDWQRGTRAQYVQVVVIAQAPGNFPEVNANSVQLAFVLAGLDAPPFEILNRRFALTGPLEPVTGAWQAFDLDLHAAFAEHWGRVPEALSALRVFAEVRFDGRTRSDGPIRARVHFDELWLGD
jgi:hypothetical protein